MCDNGTSLEVFFMEIFTQWGIRIEFREFRTTNHRFRQNLRTCLMRSFLGLGRLD